MTGHILAAIGTGEIDTTLALAIERARESNARLTAVHVVDRLPGWATSSFDRDCVAMLARVEENAQEIATRSLRTMREAGIEGACMTVDLPRHLSIARVIAQAAREIDADLIVVGRSKSPHWRIWKERVSDAVSRHGDRRVLIASNHAACAETKATPLSFTIVDSTERTFVQAC